MNKTLLTIGSILALVASDVIAEEEKENRITYVSYVSSINGKCVFQTGDVVFDAPQFEADLRRRFDSRNKMIIYNGSNTRAACIKKARKIAQKVGFHEVDVMPAPIDLNMGPRK